MLLTGKPTSVTDMPSLMSWQGTGTCDHGVQSALCKQGIGQPTSMFPAGVSVTVDHSIAAASSEDAPPTALIAITALNLKIVDSHFSGLHIAQTVLLHLANSSVKIQNTSFLNNQAAAIGAVLAEGMQQLSISNSNFESNSGMHLSADPGKFACKLGQCMYMAGQA